MSQNPNASHGLAHVKFRLSKLARDKSKTVVHLGGPRHNKVNSADLRDGRMKIEAHCDDWTRGLHGFVLFYLIIALFSHAGLKSARANLVAELFKGTL